MDTLDLSKLLRGEYEAERMPRSNAWSERVPDFGFNVLNSLGLLYRPVVDEERLSSGGRKPAWPDDKPFAVCLTHDVDNVSARSARQHLRHGWLQARTSSRLAVRALLAAGLRAAGCFSTREDPYHCYERWLELESSAGARSTFFFPPERVSRPHRTDWAFRFSDVVRFDGQRCTVAEMMIEIDRRGWEIGLHPSWYAFDDADELGVQKAQIESVIGHEVVSVRQHYLHYDIRVTPRAQAQAGFLYDSSLGFIGNVGFRFGTSYPWHLYDLVTDEPLPILEVPLIVVDKALLNPHQGLRLDEEAAFDYVVRMAEAVENVGGVLTLIWHPELIIQSDYWNLYIRAMEYLQRRNAWLASVRQVGEWWQGHRRGAL